MAPRRGADDQVSRFDIPMNQATLVSVLESQSRLTYVVANLSNLQHRLLVHQASQINAVHELHGIVISILSPPGVVNDDDMGVEQSRGRLGFPEKAIDGLRPRQQLLANHLECDGPSEANLPGVI